MLSPKDSWQIAGLMHKSSLRSPAPGHPWVQQQLEKGLELAIYWLQMCSGWLPQ